MATTYSIQSAEVNALLQFSFTDAVLNSPISLSGATVTLVATSPGTKPTRSTYSCSINGNTATYTTTGTDFFTTGRWSCQAVYSGPLGTHHSAVFYLNVLANL